MASLSHKLAACKENLSRSRPTLFGKALLVTLSLVCVNVILWITTAIVFSRGQNRRILSLALVAWTTGLRHGLDADHISLIDNATRSIISASTDPAAPSRPVTVGLFFSLGHSTVVFVTTVIIAVSVGVADHLDGFGNVGGVVGAAISGSTLLIVAAVNTVILVKTWRRLQAAKAEQRRREAQQTLEQEKSAAGNLEEPKEAIDAESQLASKDAQVDGSKLRFNGCMTRAVLPLLKLLDRPWKLYPIGLLFGLGFDTASTIALLSVSLVASQVGVETGQSSANVVILALLFTAGMALVDTLDNVLMLYAYAPPTFSAEQSKWALLERNLLATESSEPQATETPASLPEKGQLENQSVGTTEPPSLASTLDAPASTLSLFLTLLSILVALSIALIVLLSLIGDRCARCMRAADLQEENGTGGLEGRWWLAWRRASDQSGYVGAGIVGAFAVVLLAYWGVRLGRRWWRRRQSAKEASVA